MNNLNTPSFEAQSFNASPSSGLEISVNGTNIALSAEEAERVVTQTILEKWGTIEGLGQACVENFKESGNKTLYQPINQAVRLELATKVQDNEELAMAIATGKTTFDGVIKTFVTSMVGAALKTETVQNISQSVEKIAA